MLMMDNSDDESPTSTPAPGPGAGYYLVEGVEGSSASTQRQPEDLEGGGEAIPLRPESPPPNSYSARNVADCDAVSESVSLAGPSYRYLEDDDDSLDSISSPAPSRSGTSHNQVPANPLISASQQSQHNRNLHSEGPSQGPFQPVQSGDAVSRIASQSFGPGSSVLGSSYRTATPSASNYSHAASSASSFGHVASSASGYNHVASSGGASFSHVAAASSAVSSYDQAASSGSGFGGNVTASSVSSYGSAGSSSVSSFGTVAPSASGSSSYRGHAGPSPVSSGGGGFNHAAAGSSNTGGSTSYGGNAAAAAAGAAAVSSVGGGHGTTSSRPVVTNYGHSLPGSSFGGGSGGQPPIVSSFSHMMAGGSLYPQQTPPPRSNFAVGSSGLAFGVSGSRAGPSLSSTGSIHAPPTGRHPLSTGSSHPAVSLIAPRDSYVVDTRGRIGSAADTGGSSVSLFRLGPVSSSSSTGYSLSRSVSVTRSDINYSRARLSTSGERSELGASGSRSTGPSFTVSRSTVSESVQAGPTFPTNVSVGPLIARSSSSLSGVEQGHAISSLGAGQNNPTGSMSSVRNSASASGIISGESAENRASGSGISSVSGNSSSSNSRLTASMPVSEAMSLDYMDDDDDDDMPDGAGLEDDLVGLDVLGSLASGSSSRFPLLMDIQDISPLRECDGNSLQGGQVVADHSSSAQNLANQSDLAHPSSNRNAANSATPATTSHQHVDSGRRECNAANRAMSSSTSSSQFGARQDNLTSSSDLPRNVSRQEGSASGSGSMLHLSSIGNAESSSSQGLTTPARAYTAKRTISFPDSPTSPVLVGAGGNFLGKRPCRHLLEDAELRPDSPSGANPSRMLTDAVSQNLAGILLQVEEGNASSGSSSNQTSQVSSQNGVNRGSIPVANGIGDVQSSSSLALASADVRPSRPVSLEQDADAPRSSNQGFNNALSGAMAERSSGQGAPSGSGSSRGGPASRSEQGGAAAGSAPSGAGETSSSRREFPGAFASVSGLARVAAPSSDAANSIDVMNHLSSGSFGRQSSREGPNPSSSEVLHQQMRTSSSRRNEQYHAAGGIDSASWAASAGSSTRHQSLPADLASLVDDDISNDDDLPRPGGSGSIRASQQRHQPLLASLGSSSSSNAASSQRLPTGRRTAAAQYLPAQSVPCGPGLDEPDDRRRHGFDSDDGDDEHDEDEDEDHVSASVSRSGSTSTSRHGPQRSNYLLPLTIDVGEGLSAGSSNQHDSPSGSEVSEAGTSSYAADAHGGPLSNSSSRARGLGALRPSNSPGSPSESDVSAAEPSYNPDGGGPHTSRTNSPTESDMDEAGPSRQGYRGPRSWEDDDDDDADAAPSSYLNDLNGREAAPAIRPVSPEPYRLNRSVRYSEQCPISSSTGPADSEPTSPEPGSAFQPNSRNHIDDDIEPSHLGSSSRQHYNPYLMPHPRYPPASNSNRNGGRNLRPAYYEEDNNIVDSTTSGSRAHSPLFAAGAGSSRALSPLFGNNEAMAHDDGDSDEYEDTNDVESIAGSEASSTTASVYEQNLHLPPGTDDNQGISTSGQVDVNARLVPNDDGEDDDDPEDQQMEDGEDENLREGMVADQGSRDADDHEPGVAGIEPPDHHPLEVDGDVVAGPSSANLASVDALPGVSGSSMSGSVGQHLMAMEDDSHGSDPPHHVPDISQDAPLVTESDEAAIHAPRVAVNMAPAPQKQDMTNAGSSSRQQGSFENSLPASESNNNGETFKKPFNRKGRLLETLRLGDRHGSAPTTGNVAVMADQLGLPNPSASRSAGPSGQAQLTATVTANLSFSVPPAHPSGVAPTASFDHQVVSIPTVPVGHGAGAAGSAQDPAFYTESNQPRPGPSGGSGFGEAAAEQRAAGQLPPSPQPPTGQAPSLDIGGQRPSNNTITYSLLSTETNVNPMSDLFLTSKPENESGSLASGYPMRGRSSALSSKGPSASDSLPPKLHSTLNLGLAFSRLPGTSLSTVPEPYSNSNRKDPKDLTSKHANNSRGPDVSLSGPLSKRLRTRHYLDAGSDDIQMASASGIITKDNASCEQKLPRPLNTKDDVNQKAVSADASRLPGVGTISPSLSRRNAPMPVSPKAGPSREAMASVDSKKTLTTCDEIQGQPLFIDLDEPGSPVETQSASSIDRPEPADLLERSKSTKSNARPPSKPMTSSLIRNESDTETLPDALLINDAASGTSTSWTRNERRTVKHGSLTVAETRNNHPAANLRPSVQSSEGLNQSCQTISATSKRAHIPAASLPSNQLSRDGSAGLSSTPFLLYKPNYESGLSNRGSTGVQSRDASVGGASQSRGNWARPPVSASQLTVTDPSAILSTDRQFIPNETNRQAMPPRAVVEVPAFSGGSCHGFVAPAADVDNGHVVEEVIIEEVTIGHEPAAEVVVLDDKGDDDVYVCHICERKFKRQTSLDRHLALHKGEKKHACEDCGLKFSHPCNLARHRKKMHSNVKRMLSHVRCPTCSVWFPDKMILKIHSFIHTTKKNENWTVRDAIAQAARRQRNIGNKGRGVNRSKERGQQERNGEAAERDADAEATVEIVDNESIKVDQVAGLGNAEVETPEMRFQCQVKECVWQFDTWMDLVVHVGDHGSLCLPVEPNHQPSGPKHKCELCCKTFATEARLRNHMQAHGSKESKPYQCKECGKRFLTNSALAGHVKIHCLPDNNYDCPICSTVFQTLVSLKDHIHVHRSNGTFTCPHCQKVFGAYQEIRKHIRSFHSFKRFICPECNKIFPSLYKLKSHRVMHTDLRQFKCNQCSKEFKRKDKLRSHLKQVHFLAPGAKLMNSNKKSGKKMRKNATSNSSVNQSLDGNERTNERGANKDAGTSSQVDGTRSSNVHVSMASTAPKRVDRLEAGGSNDGQNPISVEKGVAIFVQDQSHPGPSGSNNPDEEPSVLASMEHRPEVDLIEVPEDEDGANKANNNNRSNKFVPKAYPTDLERFIYKCHLCKLGFKRRGMLVNHLAKRHPEVTPESVPELNLPILQTKKDFFCQYCDKVYKSSSKRKLHIQKHHPGLALPAGAREVDPDTCDVEEQTFSRTVGSITSNPHGCQYCHKQYASRAKLTCHIRANHPHDPSTSTASSGSSSSASTSRRQDRPSQVMYLNQSTVDVSEIKLEGNSSSSSVDTISVSREFSNSSSSGGDITAMRPDRSCSEDRTLSMMVVERANGSALDTGPRRRMESSNGNSSEDRLTIYLDDEEESSSNSHGFDDCRLTVDQSEDANSRPQEAANIREYNSHVKNGQSERGATPTEVVPKMPNVCNTFGEANNEANPDKSTPNARLVEPNDRRSAGSTLYHPLPGQLSVSITDSVNNVAVPNASRLNSFISRQNNHGNQPQVLPPSGNLTQTPSVETPTQRMALSGISAQSGHASGMVNSRQPVRTTGTSNHASLPTGQGRPEPPVGLPTDKLRNFESGKLKNLLSGKLNASTSINRESDSVNSARRPTVNAVLLDRTSSSSISLSRSIVSSRASHDSSVTLSRTNDSSAGLSRTTSDSSVSVYRANDSRSNAGSVSLSRISGGTTAAPISRANTSSASLNRMYDSSASLNRINGGHESSGSQAAVRAGDRLSRVNIRRVSHPKTEEGSSLMIRPSGCSVSLAKASGGSSTSADPNARDTNVSTKIRPSLGGVTLSRVDCHPRDASQSRIGPRSQSSASMSSSTVRSESGVLSMVSTRSGADSVLAAVPSRSGVELVPVDPPASKAHVLPIASVSGTQVLPVARRSLPAYDSWKLVQVDTDPSVATPPTVASETKIVRGNTGSNQNGGRHLPQPKASRSSTSSAWAGKNEGRQNDNNTDRLNRPSAGSSGIDIGSDRRSRTTMGSSNRTSVQVIRSVNGSRIAIQSEVTDAAAQNSRARSEAVADSGRGSAREPEAENSGSGAGVWSLVTYNRANSDRPSSR